MTDKKRPGYKKPPGYDPSRYARPSVACDILVFTWRNPRLLLLLIQRKHDPFKGYWAFPGGFVDIKEPLERAAKRELKEETDVRGVELFEFGAFGNPDRDPRTRVISVAYLALVPRHKIKPRAGDDASATKWFPANKPPELAFDHDMVLEKALQKLREMILLSPAMFQLLPGEFELKELKALIQELMNRKYKLTWFRERMLDTGILKSSGPGKYRFNRTRFRPGILHFLFED
jgi:8-oxo-dGTP diphosphatase